MKNSSDDSTFPAIDSPVFICYLKSRRNRAILQSLACAETKKAARHEGVVKQVERPLFQFLAEIYQNIPAEYQVHLSKTAVSGEIMRRKNHILP